MIAQAKRQAALLAVGATLLAMPGCPGDPSGQLGSGRKLYFEDRTFDCGDSSCWLHDGLLPGSMLELAVWTLAEPCDGYDCPADPRGALAAIRSVAFEPAGAFEQVAEPSPDPEVNLRVRALLDGCARIRVTDDRGVHDALTIRIASAARASIAYTIPFFDQDGPAPPVAGFGLLPDGLLPLSATLYDSAGRWLRGQPPGLWRFSDPDLLDAFEFHDSKRVLELQPLGRLGETEVHTIAPEGAVRVASVTAGSAERFELLLLGPDGAEPLPERLVDPSCRLGSRCVGFVAAYDAQGRYLVGNDGHEFEVAVSQDEEQRTVTLTTDDDDWSRAVAREHRRFEFTTGDPGEAELTISALGQEFGVTVVVR